MMSQSSSKDGVVPEVVVGQWSKFLEISFEKCRIKRFLRIKWLNVHKLIIDNFFLVWNPTFFRGKFVDVKALCSPDLFCSSPTVYVRHTSKETFPVMCKNEPTGCGWVRGCWYQTVKWISNYSMRMCYACVSCVCLMQVCHEYVSYRCVMSMCHSGVSCVCVMQGCHKGVSCRCVMQMCHAYASFRYVMRVCHAYVYLCSASVKGSLARTEWHMTCRLQMQDKTSSRNVGSIIRALEPTAWDHKKRCKTLDSALMHPIRDNEVTFLLVVPSSGFTNGEKLRTRRSNNCCWVFVIVDNNTSCRYFIQFKYRTCMTSTATRPW